MAVVKTQIARNDIYDQGLLIDDPNTKSGKRLDRSKPADGDDFVVISKGQTYHRWSFRFGGTHISATYPKRSQLTQSSYLSTLYELEDGLENVFANITDPNDVEQEVDSIKEQLESLRDECQEKLDAMPEHLQESSSSGQTLTERIEALENIINGIESEDFSYDSAEEDELDEEEIEDDDEIENQKQEIRDNWILEKSEFIKNLDFSSAAI